MLQVSWGALAALGLLLVICFVLPLGLSGLLYRMAGCRFKSCGLGAAAYFFGGFVTEMLLMGIIRSFTDMTKNLPVYLLYSLVLSPAVFLAVNFVVMKWIAKGGLRHTGDAMMYAVGYSGLENLFTTGFVAVMYMVTLWGIKQHAGSYVVVSESDYVSYSNLVSPSSLVTDRIYGEMQVLCSRPAGYFLALCFDRVWAIVVYAAALLILWMAVTKKDRLPLLGMACGVRLLIGLPTVFSDLGVIRNAWVSALLVVLLAAAAWAAAVFCWRRYIDSENADGMPADSNEPATVAEDDEEVEE